MSSNVHQHYLEAKVTSASPVELVGILYGAALDSVREARRHLASGDCAARGREISRAVEILVELSTTLDRETGGSLAGDLAELYDYLQRRLLDAHLRQEGGALAEVEQLLATLSGAWEAVAAGERRDMPAAAEAPAPVPLEKERAAVGGYGALMGAQPYALAGQSWSA